MGSDGDIDPPRKRRRINSPETGPYVLRPLIDKVPVEAEDGDEDVHITYVECWNENLYVGTSAAEILHFVSLPPDPSEASARPSFILASRQPISTTPGTSTSNPTPGVQRILILPTTNKACILCNGTVTFYSLPELSPAYGTTKVGNCNWIGGLDLNESSDRDEATADPVVMIATKNKIMLVRIGEEPRRVRNIEFPGCLAAARRDTIACVADSHSYALLEVEHRQKIPLFPISSLEDYLEPGNGETVPGRSTSPAAISNGSSPPTEVRGHGRSHSLNDISSTTEVRQQSPHPGADELDRSATPDTSADSNFLKQPSSNVRRASTSSKPLPSTPGEMLEVPRPDQKSLPPSPQRTRVKLKPFILSPTPSEFLLITGTGGSDPGVGMFVNLEGETSERGTMEFQTYPEAIVLDDCNEDDQPRPSNDDQEGYVLAIIGVEDEDDCRKYLEVQRWDLDPGEGDRQKSLVEVPQIDNLPGPVGIGRTVSSSQMSFNDVGDIMQVVRLKMPPKPQLSDPPTPLENADPRTKASIEQLQKEKELFDTQETDSDGSKQLLSSQLRNGWEAERDQEEAMFAQTLGQVKGSMILWKGDQIWRVLRNPLALQLENALQLTQEAEDLKGFKIADNTAITELVYDLDTIVPKPGPESLSLNYVKQKASLLLFGDLISTEEALQTGDKISSVEGALVSGELDPRIILLLTPLLKEEILQGPQGIWVYAGLAKVVQAMTSASEEAQKAGSEIFNISDQVLYMLMRYLISWQKKRGYGSVTDESYVFDSVDSALLHLLLELDALYIQQSGSSSSSPIRSELNRLVDNWKGNFNRAVDLLERYQRLFVLSRLYQSRKMSRDVLGTWRRIIEGEKDTGGELPISAVEIQVQKYLGKIRDSQLVEDYGLWIAGRDAQLGVQVFSDDKSRVKFDPPQVISMLKKRAPGAVQAYLEQLVFRKNIPQYTDALIAYYLDTVLSVLESSSEARTSLTESYSTYRALQSPKPSYLNFISENAPLEPWWQSRLRLLQLLGGGTRSQFTSSTPIPTDLPYSIPIVLERIEPFKKELVSECIILGGRQGRHDEALNLLTHGLGDYDSAIRYCLFGGSSESTASSTSPLTTASRSGKMTPSLSQKDLFSHLLQEFLKIEDESDRVERTGDLLARFAPLYNVRDVLRQVPDEWGVDILSDFLARVLRDLVSEGRSAKIQRALSAGLNLRIAAEFLAGAEKVGGWVDDGDEIRPLREDSDVPVDGRQMAAGQ